ncbi:hypothetical protein PHMEG_0004649 [Phytophthora megakarya]|uniref:Uncharacterized protein n=1 Tax=Phytophthora megakarya TaxID=4795 RepID=A0A225WTC3_9STRA|nr:hypothetical protein PHMEG_0004649 [Phytophthora megakarya]
MSAGESAARTEFREVGTSTEAEREMVDQEESAALGGGRGLLDPSDCMYLVEQRQLEQQAKNRERMERQVALQAFRSNALKMQAHKQEIPAIPTSGSATKSLAIETKAVVVIKAKKRQATTDEKGMKSKKSKKSSAERTHEMSVKKQNAQKKVTLKTKASVTALLLQDYSSSDEE